MSAPATPAVGLKSAGPKVFVHDEAFNEAGDGADHFFSRIRGALARGLRDSGGSTVRRLRGPWNGRAFRVRWNDLRAPVSIVPGPDGGDIAFVHQVGNRATIYESHEFQARLDHFHSEVWSESEKRLRMGQAASYTPYKIAEELGIHAVHDDTAPIAVEPLLSRHQFELLRALLPFPPSWKAEDAIVVIGKGPPGSGKTVVALDAARQAVASGQHSTLLLVPSRRLAAVYEGALQDAGIAWEPAAPPGAGAPVPVVVGESGAFLAAWAGEGLTGVERERALEGWWREVIQQSALRPWAAQHPEVREARFWHLIDATLEDPSGLGDSAKDALDAFDGPLYDLVREFRAHKPWMQIAETRRAGRGLRLRSEIARHSLLNLKQTDPWMGGLLIAVDEAQDLAPAEWMAIVDWCAARWAKALPTRLALLGDENQRVSPTSFSWTDVKTYCRGAFRQTHDLERPPFVERDLPGSFRLSRQVAELANGLFHQSVARTGKFRAVKTADPSELPDHGIVRIVVTNRPGDVAGDALRRFGDRPGTGRLRVIAQRPIPALPPDAQDSRVDVLLPRVAKGLEFPSVVVLEPFGNTDALLTYEQATVAYTAVTRAMDQLLCILSPEEWRRVETRWRPYCSTIEVLSETPGDSLRLEDLLNDMAGEASIDEQIGVEEAQLRDRLDHLPSGGSRAEAGRLARELLVYAQRLVQMGRLDRFATSFGGALLAREWIGRAMRAAVAEMKEAEWARMTAALVLLGEYAAAADVIRRFATDEDARLLGGAADRMVVDAGEAQLAVQSLRRSVAIAPDVWSGDILGAALAGGAVDVVRGAKLPLLGPGGNDG